MYFIYFVYLLCIVFYVYKNVTVLLPTADVRANSQRYNESSYVLLPVCTMAMAVKAMCNYGRVSDVIRIFIPSVFGEEECI